MRHCASSDRNHLAVPNRDGRRSGEAGLLGEADADRPSSEPGRFINDGLAGRHDGDDCGSLAGRCPAACILKPERPTRFTMPRTGRAHEVHAKWNGDRLVISIEAYSNEHGPYTVVSTWSPRAIGSPWRWR
jgi:hypothetical protein